MDYPVIGDVSDTLERVLTDALSVLTPAPAPIARLHDLSGDPPTNPPLLTIFLFEVAEDASARNRPAVRIGAPPSERERKSRWGIRRR